MDAPHHAAEDPEPPTFNLTVNPRKSLGLTVNPFVLMVKALEALGTGYVPATIFRARAGEEKLELMKNPVEDFHRALLELRDLYSRTAETCREARAGSGSLTGRSSH